MNSKKFKTLKLFIVAFVIAVVFFQLYKYAKHRLAVKSEDDIITNMLVIQKKAKLLNGNMKVTGTEEGYIGQKLTDLNDDNLKNKVKQIGISEEEFEKYYVLNTDDFNKMEIFDELKNASSNEYIVDYKNEDVIYINGIEVNHKREYSLKKIMNPNVDDAEKNNENSETMTENQDPSNENSKQNETENNEENN